MKTNLAPDLIVDRLATPTWFGALGKAVSQWPRDEFTLTRGRLGTFLSGLVRTNAGFAEFVAVERSAMPSSLTVPTKDDRIDCGKNSETSIRLRVSKDARTFEIERALKERLKMNRHIGSRPSGWNSAWGTVRDIVVTALSAYPRWTWQAICLQLKWMELPPINSKAAVRKCRFRVRNVLQRYEARDLAGISFRGRRHEKFLWLLEVQAMMVGVPCQQRSEWARRRCEEQRFVSNVVSDVAKEARCMASIFGLSGEDARSFHEGFLK